ncbi:hypothetical protein PR048_025173 [Dryococelus australis]|uniref:Uncharacterized protein n=1 Tax=Dryococelus australis TaxID=614101 RepID=A0ABQ9GQN7_9NEOP|nr:hypothetical protein PR048_025173 [Dryococelus australis]
MFSPALARRHTHVLRLKTAGRLHPTSCLALPPRQVASAGIAHAQLAFNKTKTTQGRSARSPPTKANWAQSRAGPPDFRKWESCQTMPFGGWVFSRISRFPHPSFRRRSTFTSITLIGSQDLAVKSRLNLSTHSFYCRRRFAAVVHGLKTLPPRPELHKATMECERKQYFERHTFSAALRCPPWVGNTPSSHRSAQCDENSALQFRVLRLVAMGRLMLVAVSPLSFPLFSASNAVPRPRLPVGVCIDRRVKRVEGRWLDLALSGNLEGCRSLHPSLLPRFYNLPRRQPIHSSSHKGGVAWNGGEGSDVVARIFASSMAASGDENLPARSIKTCLSTFGRSCGRGLVRNSASSDVTLTRSEYDLQLRCPNLGDNLGQKFGFPNALTWDTAAWDSTMTPEGRVHQSVHPYPKTQLCFISIHKRALRQHMRRNQLLQKLRVYWEYLGLLVDDCSGDFNDPRAFCVGIEVGRCWVHAQKTNKVSLLIFSLCCYRAPPCICFVSVAVAALQRLEPELFVKCLPGRGKEPTSALIYQAVGMKNIPARPPRLVIVSDDAAGWRVFSGISRSRHSLISALLPYSPQSPSSALKTSLCQPVGCSLNRDDVNVVKEVIRHNSGTIIGKDHAESTGVLVM